MLASFRLDHSNRYRVLWTKIAPFGGTIDCRMAGCASPSRMSLSLSITTDLRRGAEQQRHSRWAVASRRAGLFRIVKAWQSDCVLYVISLWLRQSYNRALCSRLTGLTFKSSLLLPKWTPLGFVSLTLAVPEQYDARSNDRVSKFYLKFLSFVHLTIRKFLYYLIN